jgi:penicillin amidase
MLFADRAGHIGYQFVGRVPRRADGWNGMAPRPAWESGNHWQGWLDAASELPCFADPAEGFIASANEARRCEGGPTLVNLPLAGYRHRRIREALNGTGTVTVEAMQALQYDLLSLEARTLLPMYLPHVPPGKQYELLRDWDYRYTIDSQAATLFENLHHAVIIEVLGGGGLGRDWTRRLMHDTSLTVVLAGFIDDLLKREDSHWLPAAARAAILARGVQAGLGEAVMPWGERNRVTFKHLLLGGKLPKWLGVDPGPCPLPGSHATLSQGAMFHAGARLTGFAPSYRFIADLADDRVRSNLPGGASESPWSRYYINDLKNWLAHRYKDY